MTDFPTLPDRDASETERPDMSPGELTLYALTVEWDSATPSQREALKVAVIEHNPADGDNHPGGAAFIERLEAATAAEQRTMLDGIRRAFELT